VIELAFLTVASHQIRSDLFSIGEARNAGTPPCTAHTVPSTPLCLDRSSLSWTTDPARELEAQRRCTMPPFKSPIPPHNYTVSKEKAAISRHFTKRKVPKSTEGKLLLATWNIANLGAQKRRPAALKLIAHILMRFDLCAVQEVNDDFKTFLKIMKHMGTRFDYIMTDTAGNNERLVYVYRKGKVTPTNLYGELAILPRSYPKRTVKVRWVDTNKKERVQTFKSFKYSPFDRNPFIGSFQAGKIDFTLVNVHLYFGAFQNSQTEEKRKKYARRVLEIYALAKWADGRVNKSTTYDKDIVLLGDMNVPAMDKKESTYKALIKFGWKPVDFVSKTGGSNLGNDKTYDQMTFAPGSIGGRVKDRGVFDFDKAIFKSLWDKLIAQMPKSKAIARFNRHVKHHVSDHRPLWVQLDIT
jgi:endonuclease/exonuclease/phosphatase family metal-dependent hydrolase